MKKILLYLMLWLSVFIGNGCVSVRYPDEYWGWPEDRRREWREEHHPRWYERREEKREEHHGEGHEERH
jgi:hypothetical protein